MWRFYKPPAAPLCLGGRETAKGDKSVTESPVVILSYQPSRLHQLPHIPFVEHLRRQGPTFTQDVRFTPEPAYGDPRPGPEGNRRRHDPTTKPRVRRREAPPMGTHNIDDRVCNPTRYFAGRSFFCAISNYLELIYLLAGVRRTIL